MQHYAKGNYFALTGKQPFRHLVYPVPEAAGLGIHATIDMGGRVKFGPDVEWVESDQDLVVDPARLDREIDRCAAVHPGTALAVHVARLTGPSERERVAAGLRAAPLNRPGVGSVQDVVDDITLRLHAPRPVRARGVARLRLLLADAGGPLYAAGRGSLPADLRGVLAAL